MKEDIHWLLTRVLNPVISDLKVVRQEGEKKTRFKAESHAGSVRYSREKASDVRLTKWVESAKKGIQKDHSDGSLEDALELVEKAYEETCQYAILTENNDAVQILIESAEKIEEKFGEDIQERLDDIRETIPVDISTDLEVNAPEVSFTIRTGERTPYTVSKFQGEKTVSLPKGEYDVVAVYEGVSDVITVNAEERKARLELREKLRKKQKREAEERKQKHQKPNKDRSNAEGDYKQSSSREDTGKKQSPPKHTTNTEGHEKNTDIYRAEGIMDRVLHPFRVLKHRIERALNQAWRFSQYATRRMYEIAKVVALFILITGVIIGYASPSARSHVVNGNPEGIVNDAADVVGEISLFVSSMNISDSSDAFSANKAEQEIHQHINDVREEHGLSALQYDQELSDIAREHSKDMGEREHLTHKSFNGDEFQDRYQKAGYDCSIRSGTIIYHGAENIAKSYYETAIEGGEYYSNEEELAQGTVRQWMNSPEHRKNILTEHWQREGIGVFMAENDAVYVTQNFC